MALFSMMHALLADQIDQILPQTQCRQCQFAGCYTYAQAIAADEADINQCPPGGAVVIEALAILLNRIPKPLNPQHGEHKPPAIAQIDETTCIGCALCVKACPVDAILGASRLMHTVIVEACTGCELCLPPCPVDCISLQPRASTVSEVAQQPARALAFRQRYQLRTQRLEREKNQRQADQAQIYGALSQQGTVEKQTLISAALNRAKTKRL